MFIGAVVQLGSALDGLADNGVDEGVVVRVGTAGGGGEGLATEGADDVVGGVVELDEGGVVGVEEVGFGLDQWCEPFGAPEGDEEAVADGVGCFGPGIEHEGGGGGCTGFRVEGGLAGGLFEGQEVEAEGADGAEGALVAVGGGLGGRCGRGGPALSDARPPAAGRRGRGGQDVAEVVLGADGCSLQLAAVEVALLEGVEREVARRLGAGV